LKKLFIFLVCFLSAALCPADTFTSRDTGEVFHGYATQRKRGGKTLVRMGEKGTAKYIDMADYRVEQNQQGRKNRIIVIPIKDAIELDCETAALEKAIETSSNQGPMLILIEIDTPGGREDLMKRICSAISDASNCPTVAFVSGGEYGGAYSAGAVIALTCDYIYMANDTAIGAATPILISETEVKDLRSAFGATVGEKFMSASRAYIASIAEQRSRPGALARAMVDRNIEVVEVIEDDRRLFIEPKEKKSEQAVVRTWSERGTLLTLTASEAVECGIANGLTESRKTIESKFRLEKPRIVQNNEAAKARRSFEIAKKKFDKLQIVIDRYVKEIEVGDNRKEAILILGKLIKKYEEAIALGKAYPDLNIDEESFKAAINSAKTLLRNIRKH